ncbi:hypothetical protein [Bradyrhizobium sp. CCGB01]|uniref:hypothetical protein n=1 Tax=Bradyrhizobium sp. CCGB01 TaxID=2949634 RepID=UPI0020B3E3C8|nr:hypothetical protein [Bradyrhizobium sp. CCGB01]MCP3412117.1 hypothetical protein [Bradyrhizobium sp. CCGB01]
MHLVERRDRVDTQDPRSRASAASDDNTTIPERKAHAVVRRAEIPYGSGRAEVGADGWIIEVKKSRAISDMYEFVVLF